MSCGRNMLRVFLPVRGLIMPIGDERFRSQRVEMRIYYRLGEISWDGGGDGKKEGKIKDSGCGVRLDHPIGGLQTRMWGTRRMEILKALHKFAPRNPTSVITSTR